VKLRSLRTESAPEKESSGATYSGQNSQMGSTDLFFQTWKLGFRLPANVYDRSFSDKVEPRPKIPKKKPHIPCL